MDIGISLSDPGAVPGASTISPRDLHHAGGAFEGNQSQSWPVAGGEIGSTRV
jgi:hypothetical protein